MSAPPLVSIVTATFNALDGLKHTVDSIAGQDFDSWEHVIVDGGSTDGTPAYLQSLGGNVRWVSEPDDGIADAMNKGVELASGRYVLVIHAEDTLLDAGSLSRAARHLGTDRDAGHDIVSFDVSFESDGGVRRFATRGLGTKIYFKSTIPHQGAFCAKALFDRIGGFNTGLKIAMDYDFFLRAKRAGASVLQVPEILSRMPDTGVSSRLDWPSLSTRFAEEKAIHRRHCDNRVMGVVYTLYWPAYLAYRRLRHALRGAA